MLGGSCCLAKLASGGGRRDGQPSRARARLAGSIPACRLPSYVLDEGISRDDHESGDAEMERKNPGEK